MATKGAEKEIQLIHPFVRSFLSDLAAFLTLFVIAGTLITPLINMTVIEPQQRLEKRLEKLEAANEANRDRLANIDKNLAVLAEGVNAIRVSIQNERR